MGYPPLISYDEETDMAKRAPLSLNLSILPVHMLLFLLA